LRKLHFSGEEAYRFLSGRPRVRVQGDSRGAVSHAGGVLPVETVRRTGLDAAFPQALGSGAGLGRAVHDPGTVLSDMAPAVALDRDCLAVVGLLRAESGLFRHWPWTQMITSAFDCLRALPAPG